MDKGKPGLMIALMDGLKKKGKLDSVPSEVEDDEMADHQARLEDISSDLIDAVHGKDVKAVAELLKDAFVCLEAMPHAEGPHLDEESEY